MTRKYAFIRSQNARFRSQGSSIIMLDGRLGWQNVDRGLDVSRTLRMFRASGVWSFMTNSKTPNQPAATFRDANRPLQEMVREWAVLRKHNLQFKKGDDQSTFLLFAEGALVILILEHFIRMVVHANIPGVPSTAQLRELLDRAVSKKLLVLPFADQDEGKKAICDHRNAIMHGNFEQAARQVGGASIEEYFGEHFASEVEATTRIVDILMRQIDLNTGKPVDVVE